MDRQCANVESCHVPRAFNVHAMMLPFGAKAKMLVTEVDNLQGIYPLKDEWVFGCSLKTRLADQTKTQQLK